MESWVDIKKENQIMRVPYQAFKDRFEHDGFSLVIDDKLNESPTFSVLEQVEDQNSQKKQENTKTLEKEKQGGISNGTKSRTKYKTSGKK